ncbi:hypothetical protein C8J57DRAFT_1723835 [Mycena rebaudengoi]|nr:hypothetical protein C8J57DRAFT_1723835 [Mycena rebaudengoi]
MAPGGICCDWVANPADKTELITYFKTIKEKIGQGGSWDETCLEMAAAHMRSLGPPLKGAPKNMKSDEEGAEKHLVDALAIVPDDAAFAGELAGIRKRKKEKREKEKKQFKIFA